MSKKAKILYAEDIQDLREIYAMAIEAELDCEVVEFSNGNDLIEYLKKNGDADLVLCDHNMPNGNGSDVYRYIKKEGNKVPFGLLSSDDISAHAAFNGFQSDHPLNFSEMKPFDVPKMMKNIARALGGSMKTLPDYVRVRMDRFARMSPVSVDVYVKPESSFVKLLAVGDHYSEEHHGKYSAKYGNYFYVTKEGYQSLFQECLQRLKKNATFDDKVSGLELVHEYVNALGIDPQVVAMVDGLFESVVDTVKKENNSLSQLLQKMMGKDGYLYEHSILLGYVTVAIALKSEWNLQNSCQALATAALLHDLGLDDQTARVMEYSEIIDKNIHWEISKLITSHPTKNAELLSKVPEYAGDVSVIVSWHHERPNGKGFPKALSATNTPWIAALFIIAEEFVNRILGGSPDPVRFRDEMKKMESEFSVGNYKKPFEALRALLGG